MSKGIFVTGTDTGVGKTVVTAALVCALQRHGLHVGVMKPAETGCPLENGSLHPQDSLFLRTIAGCTAPQELVTPYVFAEPLAPAIAAERAGTTIDIDHIARCYEQLLSKYDIVLVEGAGGLLVPLTAQLSMHDMAIKLGLPVLIVARNILGTINHTALTVTVARGRCQVLGIVLNHPQPASDLAAQTNLEALHRWIEVPLLGQLPFISTLTPETLSSLGEHIVIEYILKNIGMSI